MCDKTNEAMELVTGKLDVDEDATLLPVIEQLANDCYAVRLFFI